MVHETPACSSLRVPEVAAKSTKVRPVNLSTVIADVGENVTETVTFGAFATDEDTPTDEPLIVVAKMAGKDPCELAAITLSEASKMAASVATAGRALVGRLKVPNDRVVSVLADNSVPKTNSMTEAKAVVEIARHEEMMLLAP